MEILLTESQIEKIIEYYAKDGYNNIHDWYDFNRDNLYEIFQSIKNQEKIKLHKINPNQYKTALEDFMKFGKFMRFPEKYVYRWKGIMLENTSTLDNLTSIHGHTSYFPFDEFYNTFNDAEPYDSKQYNMFTGETDEITPDGEFSQWCKQKYEETGDKDYLKDNNFTTAYEFLDEVKKIDDFVPFFSNGQVVMSDFGLEPLTKLGEKLINQDDPNEIIITINKK